ncbi:MAG TPA: sigma-70 family RNA polymerase sigma factor [Chitinophaga sp.]|uniref:RNA polymerase sigma factor n=1 Tax=Chitinophaga sp. TaxID=1869181 RepID=UPI002CD02285|nr:sigma-70 family RNA polymerase sigma factor [Chitinophaga sp.]HVI44122.1 sigma-70 family RNA polymerase sigma factor [Chitinophaga sp.]
MPANLTYDEDALLARVAADDEYAYKLLFDHHWNRIYQVALSFLKNHEEAKDAVQLVFIRLWEKRDRLPEVNNFDAWLFIMARNTIINQLNKQVTATGEVEDVLPEDYLTPEAVMEYKQTAMLIAEAVAMLPPQQSLIFHLSREQGLTHPQIAAQLNIAPATVKSHIIRALNAVREHIRRCGGPALLVIWLLTGTMK